MPKRTSKYEAQQHNIDWTRNGGSQEGRVVLLGGGMDSILGKLNHGDSTHAISMPTAPA